MGKLELNGKQYCIDYEEWKALHRFYGYKVMEENKYYTPSMEEFHVGFECELYGSIGHVGLPRKDSTPGWHVVKIDSVETYIECVNSPEEVIRVKYLDRDDIESLGFNVGEWFEVDILGTWKIDFIYREHGYSTLSISTKDFIRDGSGNYHISTIRPKIKNKSELKVLLKQIGML